jgi:hypothetical protein
MPKSAEKKAFSDLITGILTAIKDGKFDPELYTLTDLIKFQHYVRTEYDAAKEAAAVWEKMYDKVSIQIVPKKMEDEETTGAKIVGVGRVELRADMWTQTLNPQALQEWLKEHDLEALIVPSVNGSTLKSFIKEQNKAGNEVPGPEIIKITPYIRAVIVKA